MRRPLASVLKAADQPCCATWTLPSLVGTDTHWTVMLDGASHNAFEPHMQGCGNNLRDAVYKIHAHWLRCIDGLLGVAARVSIILGKQYIRRG